MTLSMQRADLPIVDPKSGIPTKTFFKFINGTQVTVNNTTNVTDEQISGSEASFQKSEARSSEIDARLIDLEQCCETVKSSTLSKIEESDNRISDLENMATLLNIAISRIAELELRVLDLEQG
jgi:hypothetical protein